MHYLSIVLTGHLTATSLQRRLTALEGELTNDSAKGLLVDCQQMTGYDTDARDLFVRWNSQHRAAITTLAIVTSNSMWHMVIKVMGLAAKQNMLAFGSLADAVKWLDGAV